MKDSMRMRSLMLKMLSTVAVAGLLTLPAAAQTQQGMGGMGGM